MWRQVADRFRDEDYLLGYDFINDFSTRHITSGCAGGNYCPNDQVTRGQMAVFLVRAFNL